MHAHRWCSTAARRDRISFRRRWAGNDDGSARKGGAHERRTPPGGGRSAGGRRAREAAPAAAGRGQPRHERLTAGGGRATIGPGRGGRPRRQPIGGTGPMSTTPALDPALVRVLADGFGGSVLLPADDDYETARRVHNGLIDRRPGLIARCAATADISAAVRFAQANQLEISVRGGGHNVAGRAVDRKS